jgi:hypothetical protein
VVPAFVHVTVVPTFTFISFGTNSKSLIVTAAAGDYATATRPLAYSIRVTTSITNPRNLEDGTVLSPVLWHTMRHNRLEKHMLLDRLVDRQVILGYPRCSPGYRWPVRARVWFCCRTMQCGLTLNVRCAYVNYFLTLTSNAHVGEQQVLSFGLSLDSSSRQGV